MIASTITGAACLMLIVLVALLNADHLARMVYMGRLCSDDPERRQQGVNYLARRTDDPRVLAHARRLLESADEACFEAVVTGLAAGGRWGPDFGEAWVRYLVSRIDHVGPDQRASIAVELGRVLWHRREGHRDRRLVPAIERLLADEEADVRLNALSAAAAVPDRARRIALIESAAHDAEPAVARRAIVLLGPAQAGADFDDWRRAFEAWQRLAPPGDDEPPLAAQRDVLLLTADQISSDAVRQELRRRLAELPPDPGAPGAVDPLAAAIVSRLYPILVERGERLPGLPVPPRWTGEEGRRLREVAMFESLPTASLDQVEITPEMPRLVRLHAVRISRAAEPADLLDVFDSQQPAMRDLAVIVALDRFTTRQCGDLAKDLIAGFEDTRRMAGAMLGGMVAEADAELLDLLRLRAETAGQWVMRQHYHLALAMRGEGADGFEPRNLLTHRQMPRTTVALGLAHMGRLDGFDWLLNPFGDPPVALPLLLDHHRYAPVVERYLPGAPPLRVWADERLQQFQAEALRDWYLVHRPLLEFDTAGRFFSHEEQDESSGAG